MFRAKLWVAAAAMLAAGCVRPAGPEPMTPGPMPGATRPAVEMVNDPHSYSRPAEAVVRHLDLDLSVNFPEKKLMGVASLLVENLTGTRELVLDTRDLKIKRVLLGSEGRETRFRLGDEQEFLGRPLIIEIEPTTQRVTVEYETSPEAAAVQWLGPEQTLGKKWPFLFTQSQAILARTWIPLQDTPGVRYTYNATVRVPPALLAVMSAENPTQKNADGIYRFKMPQAIPSYLMALAVGDLEFRALGPQSGVYAEPQMVEKAAWELADTPKMIAEAEKLYGPYRWGRYDMLVLPPSFPFGGMENPRLTFLTPTMIAGDRSLVSLIAHELAHSWSGNLVTNATWNDFWLNEGFTTYFENRIMEAVFGEERAELLAALGLEDLREEIEDLGASSADTHLLLDLAGRDPDKGMTDVAYEKGRLFLRRIEEIVGRQRFDAFLRRYFEQFAFRSMTTPQFVDYLKRELLSTAELEQLDLDAWINRPGIPASAPQIESARIAAARGQARAFVNGRPAAQLQTSGWGTQEWLLFLKALPATMSETQMSELDRAFKLTEAGNAEILNVWLIKSIASDYQPAYPRLEEFLTSMGRRKFLKPLYEELAKTEKGKAFARRIYREARPTYHAVSQQTIDEILGWSS